MGTDHDDGLYSSERRRAQRRKKIAVAIAGLAAIVGGASYAVTARFAGGDAAASGDTALAPGVTPVSTPPIADSPSPPTPTATFPMTPTRIAGIPQLSLPSPTPSAAVMPDDEVAAAQVTRLLGAQPTAPSGGLVAAGEAITVANEPGLDGSQIRVVSARFDLTGRGSQLWAADNGLPIGGARCTQNLRVDGEPAARLRPNMMLCWRASAAKSVVTVATSTVGRPAAAVSAAAIDRTWRLLG